jgi:hypothetical protein
VRDGNGLKDIFTLLHQDPFLIWARYQGHRCLCECFAREGAAGLLAGLHPSDGNQLPATACA